ncbi:MAG TPA: 23S rRNA (adenine(2503)-C(2))-methyltransferase RlmN [Bacteroidales bacterium]|jgi:23S rRNA (adenine2503-C2)-methyltransferase|nr:23S rRNA (adenine(2503)-C(2))-methyltransferase RlmN [Bacteroidales bacterium]
MKPKLLGMSLLQLEELVADLSLPKYVARQIADWLYAKGTREISGMTNLSIAVRKALEERYQIGHTLYTEKYISSDGTKKYIFPTSIAGRYIETVMIPEYEVNADMEMGRATICLSSQIGCRMNCSFCMTGRMGYHGQLSAAEMISQFMNIDEAQELTNAVFMGMGEPLDNWDEVSKVLQILTSEWGFGWSPKRITLSTIGVLPKLKSFLDDFKCHLAVSLHTPFDEERAALMPVQKAFKLEEVLALIRRYDFTGQRRVSFEYIMFSGVNDTKRHADALIRMLSGLECRINLIRFHSIPDSPLQPTPRTRIDDFKARLNNAGIITTLRASRGEDIMAACGLLAGQKR